MEIVRIFQRKRYAILVEQLFHAGEYSVTSRHWTKGAAMRKAKRQQQSILAFMPRYVVKCSEFTTAGGL